LHTDHCPKEKLDGFVRPLLAISKERVSKGQGQLFQSHMWDGCAVAPEENLQIADERMVASDAAPNTKDLGVGGGGGGRDGSVGDINEKLYSTPEDALRTAEVLGLGEKGYYLTALTFGNVHGSYKPGFVKLRPEVLKTAQEAVAEKYGKAQAFDFVFHGGSGSSIEEIHEAIDYGVVKMNVDTDTQYAYTRPVVDHIMKNYDGVLKIDGEIGSKKAYDPRSYGKAAEAGMAARVVE